MPTSLWNMAITAETLCEHYCSVMGHPETEGNSLRMQRQCCLVDIMLEFTWGNDREDHNVKLLLRGEGQGTEIDSDLIWGFYKPYCGTKNSPTEVCSTNSHSYYEMPQWRRALGKRSKIPHQWAENTCFKKMNCWGLCPRTQKCCFTTPVKK